MKHKLSIQQRLILPIVLLGVVALFSNILAVFDINNVNSNAANIVDNYMVGETKLADIRHSVMNIHKLALSHIVATDYNTMISIVTQIKSEEDQLDSALEEYESYVLETECYQDLLSNYDSFKHSLVYLLGASADSKTQEAYAIVNGDVASYGAAIEGNLDDLYASLSTQIAEARHRLTFVYIAALIISTISIVTGIALVLAAIKIILKHVVTPIQDTVQTLHGSSERMNGVVKEVLKRTVTSNKSTKALSNLVQKLSLSMQEVAGNVSTINSNAEDMKSDAGDMVDECNAITQYSVAMKARADKLEQSAQTNMDVISAKVADILSVLNEAIEKSRSVDQIRTLTKDILDISSSTNLIALNAATEAVRAGTAGQGFAIIAREIRQLADSCGKTASHIQEINGVVISAVYTLSSHAQSLVDYLNESILTEFQGFVNSGKQYRDDAAYIKQAMDKFSSRTTRLSGAVVDIAGSIKSINHSVDESAAGIEGIANSTQNLVSNMADITDRMSINQEIVDELRNQMDVLVNL